MSASRRLLTTALRRSVLRNATRRVAPSRRQPLAENACAGSRLFASLSQKESDERSQKVRDEELPEDEAAEGNKDVHVNGTADGGDADVKPGPIGGFMRGLMGGQAVAVEDAFIAEAKEQGVELPPPPPPRKADLVPVKRRKRREDDGEGEQSIRDRIFGRFAGSAFMQGAFNAKERIAESIDESDNPIVNMFRNVYDRLFAENEMAMVVREIREEDPEFRISEFLRQVETELVPTILGAYLSGDRDTLRKGCTEEAYAMLNASIRERDTEGIVMDTNVLDIGDVELTAGRVLEDAPVLIVSFNTQQINCLRNKGGEVVEGSEDDIRAVYYAWAFVKDIDLEDDVPTGGGIDSDKSSEEKKGGSDSDDTGKEKPSEDSDNRQWKLMEMVIRGAHSTI